MKYLSPIKAIRKNCIDCSGGSTKEVSKCHITDCNLFPFRMGKHPKRAGVGNSLAFINKARIKSIASLSASVANVNASIAKIQINSSTQLMNRKEK